MNKFGGNFVLNVALRHYRLPIFVVLHRFSLGLNILRDDQALLLYEVRVVEVYWIAEHARLLHLCFNWRGLRVALDLLYFFIVVPSEAGNDLDLIAKELLGDISKQLLHVMRVVILFRLVGIVVHREEVLRLLQQVLEVRVAKQLVLGALDLKLHTDELFFFILKIYEHFLQSLLILRD